MFDVKKGGKMPREKLEENDWLGNIEPIEGSFLTNLDAEDLTKKELKKTRRLYRGSAEELLNRKDKKNGKFIE